ncbi:MAG: sulfotransferase [Actinobacteria bacterium]|nr:sulfotransferase [Actinomycetota bacterium]
MNVNRIRRAAASTRDLLTLAQAYPTSYYKGRKNREMFKGVGTYCMFIGYPRSGHSLVGSLLDAHPHAIVAHELDALKFVEVGFGKRQLYQLLLDNSHRFAQKGREWTGYAYEVPNQWQGRFDELRVIGDKKGGRSTLRLAKNPELLHQLQKIVASEIRLVHTLRNPYDNIATMHRRALEYDRNQALDATAEDYLSRCEMNAGLKERLGSGAVLDVHHESFVADPKSSLRELCDFLGLGYDEGYLEDCASIVFGAPRRSRHGVEWDEASLAAVRAGIERFDFLRGYSYEE